MTERIAVVGNRRGVVLARVLDFLEELHRAQPLSVIVSGGASHIKDGRETSVDAFAESSWFRLGGRVRSYRPASYDDGYGVEVWNYGGGQEASVLPVEESRVQFTTYGQACIYRDWLIALDCDRLVAFYATEAKRLHSGTALTESLAKDRDVPAYAMIAEGA